VPATALAAEVTTQRGWWQTPDEGDWWRDGPRWCEKVGPV